MARGGARIRLALIVAALASGRCASPPPAPPPPADLVLRGGSIVTLDAARPRAEALAARGGRIVATGSNDEIARYVGASTRTIDLEGKLAVPGLVEGHGHLTGLGRARRTLDLTSARTWGEIVTRVKDAAASRPAGTWILGWGWHQEKWAAPASPSVEGYPTHAALSAAVPDHPVILKHAAGAHLGIANARALAAARIDRTTPDPPGGTILRDARGNVTGVLRENAYQIALDAYDASLASRSVADVEAAVRNEVEIATSECVRKGITSFQDAHSPFVEIDVFRKMAEEGELPLRLYVMVREPNDVLRARVKDYRWIGLGDGHLTVRAIKKQIDGALGSHGAWLLAPYTDQPASAGLNTDPIAEIEETARIALENDFQLSVHAIGDRGNRETLDLYERAMRAHPSKASPRFRNEHAQLLAPEDVPRFAALGVIASMQGIHCTSDGPWVPTRIGDSRARERAYVWRALLDAGDVVSNGTDTPIEDPDPIANFHASVTRRMNDGRLFFPEQRMTRDEALRSLTSNAAYAAFEEDVLGTLTPGKYADVTVLTKDILRVPDAEILDARVALTIVGGKVVYEGAPAVSASGP